MESTNSRPKGNKVVDRDLLGGDRLSRNNAAVKRVILGLLGRNRLTSYVEFVL